MVAEQFLAGLDVAEAFQKCLVELVEVRFGFDHDGARKIVETRQRTVRQVLGKGFLQKEPLVECDGDAVPFQ